MPCDLLLVLEFLILRLVSTSHLVFGLLFLLDCVQTDARDLNREFFQRALLFTPLAILFEDLVAELTNRYALDTALFLTVRSRVSLILHLFEHVRLLVLSRLRHCGHAWFRAVHAIEQLDLFAKVYIDSRLLVHGR